MSGSSSPLDVAIVIPSFNQHRLLVECLDSVRADLAESGLAGRIVVVDNASWDGSAEMVASRFPDVTLIENEVNLGFAVACNQGGKLYQARHVVLLNNDAKLQLGSLSAMVNYADTHAEVGAVTGRLLSPEGRERYPARFFWQRWWPPRPRLHELSWVPGTGVLLKREALEAVGWLDEDFFFYNEDLDLSWRLKKGGWHLVYHPRVVVWHHEGESSRLIRPRALLEGYRGALLLVRKHHGRLAYGVTRFAMRVEVAVRLAWLRVAGGRGEEAIARREAYEAVREVLRRGVAHSPDDGDVAAAREN
ncbi:MAG TPA: glycosyltransferase family 2 protein [Oscillatoriaceae cyanobacterium]